MQLKRSNRLSLLFVLFCLCTTSTSFATASSPDLYALVLGLVLPAIVLVLVALNCSCSSCPLSSSSSFVDIFVYVVNYQSGRWWWCHENIITFFVFATATNVYTNDRSIPMSYCYGSTFSDLLLLPS